MTDYISLYFWSACYGIVSLPISSESNRCPLSPLSPSLSSCPDSNAMSGRFKCNRWSLKHRDNANYKQDWYQQGVYYCWHTIFLSSRAQTLYWKSEQRSSRFRAFNFQIRQFVSIHGVSLLPFTCLLFGYWSNGIAYFYSTYLHEVAVLTKGMARMSV